jgi:hypothetical protein
MTDILTAADVKALERIVTAVSAGLFVRRATDEDVIYEGTVRGFVVDEDGTPGVHGRDIRDLFVRVTLLSGTDAHWPVRVLAEDLNNGVANFYKR